MGAVLTLNRPYQKLVYSLEFKSPALAEAMAGKANFKYLVLYQSCDHPLRTVHDYFKNVNTWGESARSFHGERI